MVEHPLAADAAEEPEFAADAAEEPAILLEQPLAADAAVDPELAAVAAEERAILLEHAPPADAAAFPPAKKRKIQVQLGGRCSIGAHVPSASLRRIWQIKRQPKKV